MSAGKRHRARRLALQALYQLQLTGHEVAELLQQFPQRPDYAGADTAYFATLVQDVAATQPQLDEWIAEFGDIPVEQIDPVERAVLWLALAELDRHPDVPRRVVLNEAVELAKVYGAEGGHRYINGLLDKAAVQLRPHGA